MGSWQIRSWVVILSLPQSEFSSWQHGLTINVESWLIRSLGAQAALQGLCSVRWLCHTAWAAANRGATEGAGDLRRASPCVLAARGSQGEASALITAASDDISEGFALSRRHECRPQCFLLELLVVAALKEAGAKCFPRKGWLRVRFLHDCHTYIW